MQNRKGACGSKTDAQGCKGYKGYVRGKTLVVVALFVCTVAAIVVSLATGSAGLPINEVISALIGTAQAKTSMIVWNLRMPRLATAAIGGMGLAVVGCVLQSVLRNPMASASTLGVSQGAAFGAAFAIVVLGAGVEVGGNATHTVSNPYAISLCAFLSSMVSVVVILAMAKIQSIRAEGMILTGVALSTLFAGGTAMIQYFGDQAQVASIVYWTFGSLGNTTWKEIALMGAVTLAATLFFLHHRWDYTAILGGESTAHGLGVNVNRLRVASLLVCAFTASVITSFVGVLNFIGLIAPHMVRKIVGSDYRFLVPASAFMGAILLLVSDIVSRIALAPQILPIGAITSFVGAPLFVYLIYREGKRR